MPEEPYRQFRVDPAAYTALPAYVDPSRGYPNEHAERGLQLFEDLIHDEDGWGLIAIDTWRFAEDGDEAVIAAAIEAGTVEELDRETYLAKKDAILHPPEPEEEEEDPLPHELLFDLPE